MTDDGRLALQAPVAEGALPAKGTFVGNVIDGPHIARVYVAGPPDRSIEGVVRLPLEAKGLTSSGTYEGALSLVKGAPASDAIKVKLKVTDSWWWAVLALLIGTALVLYPQLLLRRWRPERALHERQRALHKSYEDAQKDFERYFADYPKAHRGTTTFERPSDADIDTYATAVDIAIRAYAQSTWYFDTTSDAYKKIDQSLRLAEKDAAFYGDSGGFGKSLVALDSALSKLAKALVPPSAAAQQETALLASATPIDREPAIARAAASALKGAVLKVGAAKARGEQADKYSSAIDTWVALADEVERYELWALALRELAASAADAMSATDQTLLRKATAKAYEARNELLDATDANALSELGTAKLLEDVYGTLASLGGRYRVWLPPLPLQANDQEPPPPVIEALTLLQNRKDAPLAPAAPAAPAAGQAQPPAPAAGQTAGATVAAWVEEEPSLTVTPAKASTVRKTRRWIADMSVILLALAVGVMTGLDSFWFGKTWGSTQDYLTIVFVGTAAQGVAKGLTGTLTQLRGGTVAPPVETAPKAAQAHPPTASA